MSFGLGPGGTWISIHEQDAFFRQQREMERTAARRRLGLQQQAQLQQQSCVTDLMLGHVISQPATSALGPVTGPTIPDSKSSLSKSLLKFGHITMEEFNAKHGVRRASE